MAPMFSKRQDQTCQLSQNPYCNSTTDEDNNTGGWWWTNAGLAIRYALVVAFFAVVAFFILFSYLHARRRIRRGQAPLPYHRWLVSRRLYPNYGRGPQYAHYNENNQQGYGMQNFQPGPPAYSQWDAPPVYQPPEGGSKTLANQNVEFVGERVGQGSTSNDVEYAAPLHPPPVHHP